MNARPAAAPMPPVVRRVRRAFGLDHARRLDRGRVKAEIMRWLADKAPEVVPVGVALGEDHAALLLLVLPDARLAMLRIGSKADRISPDGARLEEACRRGRIPLASLTDAQRMRAALRRLGVETADSETQCRGKGPTSSAGGSPQVETRKGELCRDDELP